MHVLRRPHLPHAAAITVADVALAVVLTLLFAGTLNDFGSISPSRSPAPARAGGRSTSTEPGWNLTPFTSLLRSPVRVPWAAGS